LISFKIIVCLDKYLLKSIDIILVKYYLYIGNEILINDIIERNMFKNFIKDNH